MPTNFDRRLAAAEAACGIHAQTDEFPGWDFLCGLLGDPVSWFAAHGFADALTAWQAGVRGVFLDRMAVGVWLKRNGHESPALAVAAGTPDGLPAGLEYELRVWALTDLYQTAGDCIVGDKWQEYFRAVTPEVIKAWHKLRDALSPRPIPMPTDEVLASGFRLLTDILEGMP